MKYFQTLKQITSDCKIGLPPDSETVPEAKVGTRVDLAVKTLALFKAFLFRFYVEVSVEQICTK